ncbi:MAG TPA: DUF742 domain-containing protein [Nocardioides sp.]|jgi:hypothetical protein|uniref:DUF742 domain-containing protein n=1 Tax=Nocardioides sp. TaxID=35761 RepID=UPI002E31E8BC|nr:DUF742 domain-containing protein [Nocardioides sp.]HEX3932605.1 DUF742 domain-containing protein [Nocardioides sp.]
MAEEPEVEKMHASPPAARIVRPYALTAGRTRAVVDLPLEAVLRLDTSATRRAWNEDVTGKIISLCDSRSVAEVSALVQRPIGVVRVLVGDLVQQGFVHVQATLTENSTDNERFDLLERTLRGLRAL